MVDKLEKNRELPRPERSVENPKQDSEAIKEVVEGTEVAEFIDGEVSEQTSEDKKKVSSGALRSSKSAQDDQSASAHTAAFPDVDVMRIQISTQVKKEIIDLEKQASRMMRATSGRFEPFQLNQAVSRIRRLRDLLANLAHSTAETVKSLWQKYTKGTS